MDFKIRIEQRRTIDRVIRGVRDLADARELALRDQDFRATEYILDWKIETRVIDWERLDTPEK